MFSTMPEAICLTRSILYSSAIAAPADDLPSPVTDAFLTTKTKTDKNVTGCLSWRI
jgi:hypothetical protein